jgi:hypothetical protein
MICGLINVMLFSLVLVSKLTPSHVRLKHSKSVYKKVILMKRLFGGGESSEFYPTKKKKM